MPSGSAGLGQMVMHAQVPLHAPEHRPLPAVPRKTLRVPQAVLLTAEHGWQATPLTHTKQTGRATPSPLERGLQIMPHAYLKVYTHTHTHEADRLRRPTPT